MKQDKLPITILAIICMMGCASNGFLMSRPQVNLYGQTYPGKNIDAKLEVFNTSKPERAYTEIAQITCGDTDDAWNIKQILIKAREIGADAIIIVNKAGSQGVGVPIGNMVYMATENYGISAIAIKYK